MAFLKKTIKRIVRLLRKRELVPIIVPTANNELLKNKIALITGGSSGIGLAIATRFIESGAKVIITGTNEKKLRDAVDKLGTNATYVVFNVTDTKAIDQNVQKSIDAFPEKRIDILVNCAGVAGKEKFGSVSEDEFDRIIDTNLKGTFFVSQSVCNYMVENKIRGHILNISSSSALRPAWTPYQIAKWGINGFTKGLADAMIPYGIVVNAIGPGQTATPMLSRDESTLYHESCPAGRYSTPEEIANLAAFMVSSMADMVVGDTFYITGGSGTISMHS